jgi:hypothetical protein
VEGDEILLVFAWSIYYSGLVLGLPLWFISRLVRRRQWSLRMWLMLPAVVLLMLTAISTKASGALFPTWGSRMLGAVSTLPVLWLAYRVLGLAARRQWQRVGLRTAMFIALVSLVALIPWIIVLIVLGSGLEEGEHYTYRQLQWLLIPAVYLATWLVFVADLMWMSNATLRRRPHPPALTEPIK